MAIVHIGIGSNLGEREDNCKQAIALIILKGLMVTRMSSISETEPWGVTSQQKFLNAVVEAQDLTWGLRLLDLLKKIEGDIGRLPSTRWGPRLIDLDILFYDDLVMKTKDLEIPHHYMQERDFVLKPLVELDPDKMHPVLNKTVKQLLAELNK